MVNRLNYVNVLKIRLCDLDFITASLTGGVEWSGRFNSQYVGFMSEDIGGSRFYNEYGTKDYVRTLSCDESFLVVEFWSERRSNVFHPFPSYLLGAWDDIKVIMKDVYNVVKWI